VQVRLSNGGSAAGKVEAGDKVIISFSEALDVNKVCSAWKDNAITQRLDGDNQVTASINASNNLTLTSDGCSTLKLGSIALGAKYVKSGNISFKGTNVSASVIEWSPTDKTMTITLGAQSAGGELLTDVKAEVARFTPAAMLTDIAGNSLPTSEFKDSPASQF
jgi:hypothetical protein